MKSHELGGLKQQEFSVLVLETRILVSAGAVPSEEVRRLWRRPVPSCGEGDSGAGLSPSRGEGHSGTGLSPGCGEGHSVAGLCPRFRRFAGALRCSLAFVGSWA